MSTTQRWHSSFGRTVVTFYESVTITQYCTQDYQKVNETPQQAADF